MSDSNKQPPQPQWPADRTRWSRWLGRRLVRLGLRLQGFPPAVTVFVSNPQWTPVEAAQWAATTGFVEGLRVAVASEVHGLLPTAIRLGPQMTAEKEQKLKLLRQQEGESR